MVELWQWFYDLRVSVIVRESLWLFPTLEWIHIYSMIFLITVFAVADIRLLGIGFASQKSISGVLKRILQVAWIAFGVNVVTGGLLFFSAAPDYVANPAFLIKISLIFLAFLYHWIMLPAVARREDTVTRSWLGRMVGGVSLVIWIGIIAASRWIAFV